MTDQTLPASRFAAGEFRVGNVFSRTASVFGHNFLTFMLVTGIASLPSILVRQPGAAGLLNLLLLPLAEAIIVCGAFEVMRGRPINLGESAKVGLRRSLPVLGLAIVVSVPVVLGTMLLVVPGIMLYTMWFVATPVCVVERLGVFGSMRRSRELTKGNRWRIFGLVLVALAPALIVGGILGGIEGAGGTAALGDAANSTVGKIANLIWSALWTAFYNIVVVVAYHDLRVAKEGVDTEQIAAVFD